MYMQEQSVTTLPHCWIHLVTISICGVCEATYRIASTPYPISQTLGKKTRDYYNDKELTHLCKASKSSWLDWKNAGRPLSGHLHKKRNSDKKRVCARLNLLMARQDRMNSLIKISEIRPREHSALPKLELHREHD